VQNSTFSVFTLYILLSAEEARSPIPIPTRMTAERQMHRVQGAMIMHFFGASDTWAGCVREGVMFTVTELKYFDWE